MGLVAGQRLGPYEIVGPLGAGGMGEVYRAGDPRLGREVAIKVLPADLAADPERVARFEREARAVAALSHPNILSVFDVGREGPVSYVVLELLEGQTLRERLQAEQPSWRKAVEIGGPIAEGLAAAHAQGIVHRDIKPENLFVTDDGVVKILDFGLARTPDAPAAGAGTADAPTVSGVSLDGVVMGTAGYMAPEQVSGGAVDARADIFALGCVLYEMLAGRRAFRGASPAAVIAAILRDAPPDLAQGGVVVPRELERVVLRCLEKRPAERFQSARDLAYVLRTLATSEDGGGYATDKAADAARIRSLAVLPLRNLAGDPEQDFFVDGMTEALIADLSGIRGVRVASRSSTMQYRGVHRSLREVARELDVDAIIEGSVLRSGERVRITVELVHAATDANLWAQSYERDLRDVLAIQGEVTRAIVGEIQGQLSPQTRARLVSPRQVDPAALEAYLKGRYYWNRRTEESLKRGIDFFHRAIELEPTYALAYAGVADSYNILGFYCYLPPTVAFPRAKAAALRALEMDPTLTGVHALVGYVRLYHDWAGEACEEDFRRALADGGGSGEAHRYYGNLLTVVGRFDEALAELRQACRLDPLSLINSAALGWVHYFRRDHEAAVRQGRNTLDMDRTFALAHLYLSWSLQLLGRHDEALAALEQADKYAGAVPLTRAFLAEGLARAGNEAAARRLLDELLAQSSERYVSAYLVALVHVALDRPDEAFACLERAVDERAHFLVFLEREPKLDALRADPRFAKLQTRIAAEARP